MEYLGKNRIFDELFLQRSFERVAWVLVLVDAFEQCDESIH